MGRQLTVVARGGSRGSEADEKQGKEEDNNEMFGQSKYIYSEITLGCWLSSSQTRHTLLCQHIPFHPPFSHN